MPINEITVERLKMFVLLGHSNADGQGDFSNLVANFPSYAPKADWETDQANAYWDNIYVLTSAQPFPGDENTPINSLVSDVAWLEMTVANPPTPSAPHPHASPWNFPNVRGSCLPRWLYAMWGDYDPDWASGAGGLSVSDLPTPNDSPAGTWYSQDFPATQHGVEVPLSYYWRSYWQDQVGFCKMAQGGSFLMPYEAGTNPQLYLDPFWAGLVFSSPGEPGFVRSSINIVEGQSYGYWTPSDCFDWAPATSRFYKKWYDKMVAGATALPSGVKMDVRLVVIWMGDNDSATREQSVLENAWEDNVRGLIKRIRQDLVANDWTTLPEEQIPIIWPKVYPGYQGPENSPLFVSADFCNSVLDTVAEDDIYFRAMTTSDLETMEDLGENLFNNIVPTGAPNHYGSTGYHTAAMRIMDLWEDMQVTPFDALDLNETLTVSQVKDRVRSYYGKSRASTDLGDETNLLQHINSAMHHCLNHAGDNLWWLRRRMQLSLTAGVNTIVTLPRYVHRVLKIESLRDVDYPMRFEQIGHAEGGKLQILIHNSLSGSYPVHFITMPRDLVSDGQRIPMPRNLIEWLVVETCRRIAASSGQTTLQAFFQGESMEQRATAMRNMSQVQRSKRDRLQTNRRMVNLSYRNRSWNW